MIKKVANFSIGSITLCLYVQVEFVSSEQVGPTAMVKTKSNIATITCK